jgi:hypothetical protein
MNTFAKVYSSDSKQKDYYYLHTYPLGVQVVEIESGNSNKELQCRCSALLNLLDHFIVEEARMEAKPSVHSYMENISKINKFRTYAHIAKEKKLEELMTKQMYSALECLLEITEEAERQSDFNQYKHVMVLAILFKHTLENDNHE